MPCYSPLKGFKDEETGGLVFKSDGTKETMEVACGQCLGCRLDRSRMWAARIVHETTLHQHTNGNCFVTLTYRPKYECTPEQLGKGLHIPPDWSLNKRHFQLFMKRLRKKYKDRKIKYYHCGEYGNVCKHGINLELVGCPMCNLGRPHYHVCLFNISFNEDLVPYQTETDGTERFTSPILMDLWGYGHVDVAKLEFQSAAYVARYCMKKITGDLAEDHYQSIDEYGEIKKLVPEYATMSNGVGREWYEKYKDDLWPSDEMPVPGHGVVKKVPRYYEEILKTEDEEMLEAIKEKRLAYRDENAGEYTSQRLESRYKVKKAQTKLLSRTIE